MPNRRTPPRGGRPPRNNRPAQRGGTARPRSAGSAAAQQVPKAKFTNRAAILLVVFALLVVSYASSMRAYLNQRAHIRELEAKSQDYNLQIASAEEELDRWKSSGYIEQQARTRFGWVMPGETAYQVLDSNGNPLTGKDKLADPSTVAQPPEPEPEAWWSKIGASVKGADQPPAAPPPEPTPATRLGTDGKPR